MTSKMPSRQQLLIGFIVLVALLSWFFWMQLFTLLCAASVVAFLSFLWDSFGRAPPPAFEWNRYLRTCLLSAISFALGVAWWRGWGEFW